MIELKNSDELCKCSTSFSEPSTYYRVCHIYTFFMLLILGSSNPNFFVRIFLFIQICNGTLSCLRYSSDQATLENQHYSSSMLARGLFISYHRLTHAIRTVFVPCIARMIRDIGAYSSFQQLILTFLRLTVPALYPNTLRYKKFRCHHVGDISLALSATIDLAYYAQCKVCYCLCRRRGDLFLLRIIMIQCQNRCCIQCFILNVDALLSVLRVCILLDLMKYIILVVCLILKQTTHSFLLSSDRVLQLLNAQQTDKLSLIGPYSAIGQLHHLFRQCKELCPICSCGSDASF